MDSNLLLAVIFLPVGVALVVGFWYFRQESLDRNVARYNKLHRYNPDPLGNYPAYYDFHNDIYLRPDPGNTFHAPQYFLTPSTTPERTRNEKPVVIKDYRYKATVLEPEQLERPEQSEQKNEPEQIVQPESVRDYGFLLMQAKRDREPKTKAIPRITGCSRGGGVYQDWSKIWDEL